MIKFRKETDFKKTSIGEIPKDWEVKPVKDWITGMIKGKPPKKNKPNNKSKAYPYISVGYLRGEETSMNLYSGYDGILVPDNEVLIIWDGANAGEVLKSKAGLLGSTLVWLKTKENVIKYLFYRILKMFEQEIKSLKSGTDDRHVDKDAFLDFLLPHPSLEEQQRITKVLSWFDDLIENKRKQDEILEKTAMAIFKNWFIYFEPFREEEFVYSEELDMEIPKEWEVKPIGEIAEVISGFSYKRNEKLENPESEAYVFITLKNTVEGGGFNPEYSWIKSYRLKERHFIEEGDLILPSTEQTKDARLLGSPGIVILPPGYKIGVYSMDVAKVVPRDTALKYYLYFNFKFNREHVATFHSGTSILHFKIQNFKENYYIPVPPKPILEKFHSLVEPLFRKILINEKEIMVLKKARDTLLPQLVFGRLRVEEI